MTVHDAVKMANSLVKIAACLAFITFVIHDYYRERRMIAAVEASEALKSMKKGVTWTRLGAQAKLLPAGPEQNNLLAQQAFTGFRR